MFKCWQLVLICFFIASLSVIPGCWDHSEIEEMALIRAIAVDYVEGERSPYLVTIHVVRPGGIAGSSESAGGGDSESPDRIFSATGATIDLALQNITFFLSRRIFLAHNEFVLMGEEAARQGIYPAMDFVLRDNELRLTNFLLIVPGAAHEILAQREQLETGLSEEILGMIAQADESSESDPIEFFKIMRSLSKPGQDAFAAVINAVPRQKPAEFATQNNGAAAEGNNATNTAKILYLSGTAAFRGDKLAGYLDKTETRGLLWLNGDVRHTTLAISDPLKPSEFVSVYITHSQTRITPVIKNDNISFLIDVKTEGNIYHQPSLSDLSATEMSEKLNSALSAVVKKEIEGSLQKMQELESDLVGFGNSIYRKDPKKFKKIKKQWPEIFSDLTFQVHVEANIRRTGQLAKPIPEH